MSRAAPPTPSADGTRSSRGPATWRKRRGLLRSLLTYYGLPFKIRRLADLYRPFVHPGDLCFDIGAHVGDRTRALRRLGARVIAVEPQPACLEVLRWLYAKDSAVTIVASAVGEAVGEATLFVSERTPTVSSVSPEWVEAVQRAPRFAGVRWEGRLAVPVTTLDDLVRRFGRPAFCKLDIEGSEPAALRGLTQAIPVVAFEYIPLLWHAVTACLIRLEALGRYEYNWTVREIPRFRSDHWLSVEEMDSVIGRLPDGDHSGDVFARLRCGDPW